LRNSIAWNRDFEKHSYGFFEERSVEVRFGSPFLSPVCAVEPGRDKAASIAMPGAGHQILDAIITFLSRLAFFESRDGPQGTSDRFETMEDKWRA
jgi:hypothetical protein